jgi:hypothetical protein
VALSAGFREFLVVRQRIGSQKSAPRTTSRGESNENSGTGMALVPEAMPLQHARTLGLAVGLLLVCGQLAVGSELASYRLTAGWATFGLALPRGAVPAGTAVRVGALATQTDIKRTWDDGSIRFAVVTANVPRAGTYLLTTGSNIGGTFGPAWPDLTVDFTINGARWTARLPATLRDSWLDGSLVQEARAVVAPMQGAAVHPLLRVLFDVRAYSGDGFRADVTVENCLDVDAGEALTYEVKIMFANRVVFEKAAVAHGYLARWRRVFALNLRESEVTPDMLPFVAARAFPRFLPTVDAPPRKTDGPRFDILGTGDLMVPMDAHGGRPELAPYPDWTAQYLVHRRPDQREYMLRHGEAAGSWGIHVKDTEGRLISIDRQPMYWLDPRAPSEGRARVVAAFGALRGRAVPGDIAHQPSLAYVPYLLTGDRFFLDEMKYWANFCLIGSQPDDYARNGAAGLLVSNEVRGIGWALRNVADAAAYTPDRDPDRAYFERKLRNNLEWLENYARKYDAPLGTLFTGHRRWAEDTDRPQYVWIALWEHIYVAWAVDHALQQGFGPGAALRDRVARLQLRLFTSADEGFDPAYAGAYVLAVARPSLVPGQRTYLTNLRDVFTVARDNRDFRPFPGYYGPEARLMLLVAQAQGWAEANDAMTYLMGATDADVTMIRDLNRRSGWAISEAR